MAHPELRARPLPKWVDVPAVGRPAAPPASVRLIDAPATAPTLRTRLMAGLAASRQGAPAVPPATPSEMGGIDLDASLEAELVSGLDIPAAPDSGAAVPDSVPAGDPEEGAADEPADNDYRALWASQLRAALGGDEAALAIARPEPLAFGTGAADEDGGDPAAGSSERRAAVKAGSQEGDPGETDDPGELPARWMARRLKESASAGGRADPPVASPAAGRALPRVRDLAMAGVLVVAAAGGGAALLGGGDRTTRVVEAGALVVPEPAWRDRASPPKSGRPRIDAAAPHSESGGAAGEAVSAVAQTGSVAGRDLTEAQLAPQVTAGAAPLAPAGFDMADVTLRGPGYAADKPGGGAPDGPAPAEAAPESDLAVLADDQTEPVGEGDASAGDVIEESAVAMADPVADAPASPPPSRQRAAPTPSASERIRASAGRRAQMTAALAAGRPAGGHTTTAVNMRAKPDNNAAVVAVVPAGAQVVVASCNLWCQVRVNGKQGWIFKSFLADGMR